MEAYPFQIIENGEKLRLEWDTWRVCKKKDEFWMTIFALTVWMTVPMFATYAIFMPDADIFMRVLYALWCIFAWGFTFVVIYVLAQWFWTEWIEVSREFLSHGAIGLFSGQPKTLSLDSISGFGISPRGRLRVLYDGPGRPRIRRIGRWLPPDMVKHIFQVVADFVARKQIPLRMAT